MRAMYSLLLFCTMFSFYVTLFSNTTIADKTKLFFKENVNSQNLCVYRLLGKVLLNRISELYAYAANSDTTPYPCMNVGKYTLSLTDYDTAKFYVYGMAGNNVVESFTSEVLNPYIDFVKGEIESNSTNESSFQQALKEIEYHKALLPYLGIGSLENSSSPCCAIV